MTSFNLETSLKAPASKYNHSRDQALKYMIWGGHVPFRPVTELSSQRGHIENEGL